MTGAEYILEERKRQIEEEGWTAEHDDEYTEGQLVDAACCYALFSASGYMKGLREIRRRHFDRFLKILDIYWPWDRKWWKPSCTDDINGRILECIKAGALMAAEIDRLKRLEQSGNVDKI